MRLPTLFASLLCCAVGPATAAPFALDRAAGLPAWLDLAVESRLRYETLDNQFRANGRGGDQAFALRTLAHLEAGSARARVGLEMIDARVLLDDAGTPLDTGQVGAADLLQAYALHRSADGGFFGATSELRVGRQTLDLGSRRIVARNRFRNTINAFTGLDWRLAGRSGWTAEAFAAAPVVRRPDNFAALAVDAAAFDEEDFGTLLWLVAWTSAPSAAGGRLETFLVGLAESDRRVATRNRRLLTPGARLIREPAAGRCDYEVEVMLQAGTSRADDRATTVTDLDHLAHREHLQLGCTLRADWSPRVAALFDHASGDGDPRDRDNGRFDTLFGARRFDFGPTGLWGAFQRSNIVSPGARLNFAPAAPLRVMATYRAFWLASRRDQWVSAGVRDPSGRAGRFVGQQLEFSATWTLLPGNVALEIGGVGLLGGRFAEHAPNRARDGADSAYLYSQLTLSF